MKIGLLGFGCVASGVYQSLLEKAEWASIEKICVKNSRKKRNAPSYLFTNDPEDILENDSIDVIIELIDDVEAAFRYVKKALSNQKPVISANKRMIAENLEELNKLQALHSVQLLYEGAVAGSIPVIQLLKTHYLNQEIHSIRGILNGSTNYILTQMHEEKAPYPLALQKAQNLGFAESDPSLDVSGMDIFYKCQILTYHAFGGQTEVKNLKIKGINQFQIEKILQAEKNGTKVKLIATISRKKGIIEIVIEPVEIDSNDPFFLVDNEFNAIEIESSLSGKHTYFGKGAGSLPTASAVLQDLQQLSGTIKEKISA